MTAAKQTAAFDSRFLITLTDEERKYLSLAPISPTWTISEYRSKTNFWHTRTAVFFEGDTIVKVISENKRILEDGTANYETYTEYDTALLTDSRTALLPLTSRGKPKRLSASNILAVSPFGCSFCLKYETGTDTQIRLTNPRANKTFPLGEWDTVSAIRSESDFHAFMNGYISSCREDYFEKLQSFRTAKKVTVKYRIGDIFRMELDRTRYCYGIITGEVRQFRAMSELPEKHSMRHLMMVPIMVRLYRLVTDDANLNADGLKDIPLGRTEIVADNDIIWGTHSIIAHKQLTPDDLEFPFVCTKVIAPSPHTTPFTLDMLMHDGLIPQREYTLYIEWGFAQTSLPYHRLSDRLKKFLRNYSSPHGGVCTGIDARHAVPDQKLRQSFSYRSNLLNSENQDILNEIFACLNLPEDTDFDRFAQRFGGLTRSEILSRLK